MLVLSRHRDETIVVDLRNVPRDAGLLTFTIVDIRGDKVRVGCEADATIPIHRKEVFDAIERQAIAP